MSSKAGVVVLITLLMLDCQSPSSPKLIIATAANMQFAMDALTQAFAEETGINCDVILSSSGKLTAQITEGAPFDVFVSADLKYPQLLFEQGLTLGEPTIYAYGKLILWTMVDEVIPSIELLEDPSISHIALANPKTAPYGKATIEVLQYYGIHEQVKGKLVFGESIAQTNQFITTKAAEIGFTAMSVVASFHMRSKGEWIEIAGESYSPIAQGAVLLKNQNGRQEEARRFFDFLFSETAKKILEEFGYLVG